MTPTVVTTVGLLHVSAVNSACRPLPYPSTQIPYCTYSRAIAYVDDTTYRVPAAVLRPPTTDVY